jgi:ATP-dependent helicase/nuclease subunit B
VQFLLGPAGSGKTFRCLAEIRTTLAASPDGPPLILLAPKQATFQLERQLLAGSAISGYSRLQVLSFDRLARFAFEKLNVAAPRLLSAEGRLMVLRALLRRHAGELKLLHSSARRPGFAQELGGQLAELQQQQFGPARLRALAANESLRPDLRDKLLDLALLSERYSDWLAEHDLQDANLLLEIATGRLHAKTAAGHSPFAIEHLWLDGFAEMTPQEHALLAAVVPLCRQATLAFCLETEPTPTASWLSIWSAIGKTFQRCRAQLSTLPGCKVHTEILPRAPGKNRFAENSALAELEAGWSLPAAGAIEVSNSKSQISLAACANPDEEALLAAREILRFIRQSGENRFRDCAVLVRGLEHYHQPLARTFRRYNIPFFLDRRENVSHHPLAELTRGALRTVVGDWQPDDWFATLKAGFSPLPEAEIDRLENLAIEYGWHGKKWRATLPDEQGERLRQQVIAPFEKLYRSLLEHKMEPTGPQLAAAIRGLWNDLAVETALEEWSLGEAGPDSVTTQQSVLHRTVFEQMTSWLDNVALAFPREPLPLRDWLPVLDAGLAGLTVGVIPPALDEVLIGAIDRARNPNLKLALLLGVNESVFPAAPASPVILTNADRADLEGQNAALGTNVLDQISRERYLGYIACTRASDKLAVSYSRQDASGRALNPSPLTAHLQRNFPALEVNEFASPAGWSEAEHACELIPEIIGAGAGGRAVNPELLQIPALEALKTRLAELREPAEDENLSPALAEKIHGAVLKSSVSRLEEFAQCPFRFFVHSGLQAEERKRFELDARERGSFQHEVLKKFHDDLTAENKRWRDLTPAEARNRIGQIAAGLAPIYREGLLGVDDRSRFAARALTAALQDFVETLVGWMRSQYDFSPAKAETGFGLDDPGLPAWKINLGQGHALALRGRIDRIDLCDLGDQTLATVIDYKSSSRKLDKVLVEHGVQLQLLAYLATVRRWPAAFFGDRQIVPAGVFYVNLRGQFEAGASRTEVLANPDAAQRLAYRHSGRFDTTYLDHLDRLHARDQFNYQLNKDGSVRSNSAEALSGGEFVALLDQVEAQLRTLGEKIYSGAAGVDPYRKGSQTACDYCEYRAACRIDEWSHEFRELRATEKSASPRATSDNQTS